MKERFTDMIGKTCLLGLSYFDANGEPIKQNLLAGRVSEVDTEEGIRVKLISNGTNDGPTFTLPTELSCWFAAPAGRYHTGTVVVDNPDFLVTWDIYQTRQQVQDGAQQWWEWRPRTIPPKVGQAMSTDGSTAS